MKLKMLIMFMLIIAGIAVMMSNVSAKTATEDEYATALEAARINAEKGIPYLAVQRYLQAFKIKCDDEAVYKDYIVQANELGEDYFKDAVQNYLVYFPNSKDAYEYMCEYYYNATNYSRVLDIALEARDKGLATDKVRDYYMECAYMYQYIRTGVQEAHSFVGNYAKVKVNDLYGYLNDGGSYQIAPIYEDASIFLDKNAAVYKDDEWYMINEEGYKVAITDKEVESLSFLNNERMRVSVNGKYGYVSKSMVVPDELKYEAASNYKKGLAAVEKDGKWAIINTNEELVTDYIYDDILLDENETCFNNGVIFAKRDKKYYMLNEKGEVISENGFDDAYPFVADYPAAVCIDGKWGFVDAMGNIVIEPQYDAAKSFNIGLGAVCENGVWGYINTDKEYLIQPSFADCLPFSSNGITAVKENETWNYIKLLAYIN